MKKTIQVLVIILLSLIIVLISILAFNPFNLRSIIIGSLVNSYFVNTEQNYEPVEESSTSSNTEEIETQNPLLTEEQEATLESYGIDVSQLPSTITPEMEACFVDKLGEERTQAIVAGSSPSAMEFFKAKPCLDQ